MHMKKIISLLCIAALFQSSSMTAFAENVTIKNNDDKAAVPTANPIDKTDYSKIERDEETIKLGFSGAREATAEQIEESKNKTGDINFDGKVDISDLTELSLALIGDKELTKMQQKAADVDGDGRNTLADLAKYRQYISKVISTLVPETGDKDDSAVTYSAKELLEYIDYYGSLNFATPVDYLSEKYPIEKMAAPENMSPYCIYNLDDGKKMYVFFDYNTHLVTSLFIVDEPVSSDAFKSLKKGMTLSDVENIDPGTKILDTYGNNPLAFSQTLHMTSDGFVKITYMVGDSPYGSMVETRYFKEGSSAAVPLNTDDFVIGSVDFIPNGDEMRLYYQESDRAFRLGVSEKAEENAGIVLTRITDHARNNNLPVDDSFEKFYEDEKYIYSFNTVRSQYVECKFSDGSKMNVKDALESGLVTIDDLDRFAIKYVAETKNPETKIPVTEDPPEEPEPSRTPSGVMSGNEYIFNGVSCNEYTTNGIGFMCSGTYIIASGDDLEKCISDIPDFISNKTERLASILEKATGYENPDEEYFKNNVLLIINSYEGSGSYKLFFDGLAMDKAGDKVTLTSKISHFSPYAITCDMKEWNFLISVPKKAFAGIGLDNVTLISDINRCFYDDRKFNGGVEVNCYKQDEDTITVCQNTSSTTLSEDKLIKKYLSSFDDFNLVKEKIGMDEIKNNTSVAALEVRKNINANYFDKGGRIVYLHIPEGSGSIKVKFDHIDVSGNNITVFYDDRVPEDMAITDDMKYHNLFVCIPSGLLSEIDETQPVTVEAVSVG